VKLQQLGLIYDAFMTMYRRVYINATRFCYKKIFKWYRRIFIII